MSKVTVLSEKGKLVGTWIPPQQPPQPGAPVTQLVAGPGQKLHEIDVKNAELFHGRDKSEELIKLVKKQLQASPKLAVTKPTDKSSPGLLKHRSATLISTSPTPTPAVKKEQRQKH